MKKSTENILESLIARYPVLEKEKENVKLAFLTVAESYENGGKLFVCGNGGSSSDAEHIVGELMKSFLVRRKIDEKTAEELCGLGEKGRALAEGLEGALPAISLGSHQSLLSAFANDREADMIYAQQLYGLGRKGDVLIAISTSGNSENVFLAALTAKAIGAKVISLTGDGGGRLAAYADTAICVPERETYKVQELHLPVYHALCAMLENERFGS